MAFFPQLLQGPILRYGEFAPALTQRQENSEDAAAGATRFCFGLAKKVLLADSLGVIADAAFSSGDRLTMSLAWLGGIAYTLQLYFDFSGYCDMATGVALMFNIRLPINFNSPYKSLNIREFWQRWHITLSRFLTTYIYFPLGGSRKGMARTCINLMLVFLVSGLWHGAGWLFLLWGLMHGAASVFYRLFRKQYDALHPALQWLINFGFIVVAWVFFRAASLTDALAIVKSMFMMDFAPISSSHYLGVRPAGRFPPGLQRRIHDGLASRVAVRVPGHAQHLRKDDDIPSDSRELAFDRSDDSLLHAVPVERQRIPVFQLLSARYS